MAFPYDTWDPAPGVQYRVARLTTPLSYMNTSNWALTPTTDHDSYWVFARRGAGYTMARKGSENLLRTDFKFRGSAEVLILHFEKITVNEGHQVVYVRAGDKFVSEVTKTSYGLKDSRMAFQIEASK